ncbi:hypothetical protein PIB30_101740, partial [Stylosanthes scabra]|nr:hypothetical protein [Stylosanthes scabra]
GHGIVEFSLVLAGSFGTPPWQDSGGAGVLEDGATTPTQGNAPKRQSVRTKVARGGWWRRWRLLGGETGGKTENDAGGSEIGGGTERKMMMVQPKLIYVK